MFHNVLSKPFIRYIEVFFGEVVKEQKEGIVLLLREGCVDLYILVD
jgi:hypothetical protein